MPEDTEIPNDVEPEAGVDVGEEGEWQEKVDGGEADPAEAGFMQGFEEGLPEEETDEFEEQYEKAFEEEFDAGLAEE